MTRKTIIRYIIPLILFCSLFCALYINKKSILQKLENICIDYIRYQYHIEISYEDKEIHVFNPSLHLKNVKIQHYPDIEIFVNDVSIAVTPFRFFEKKILINSITSKNIAIKGRFVSGAQQKASSRDYYSIPFTIQNGNFENTTLELSFSTGTVYAEIPNIEIKEDDRFVKQYLHDVQIKNSTITYRYKDKTERIKNVNLNFKHRPASLEITHLKINDESFDIGIWGTFQNFKNFSLNSISKLQVPKVASLFDIPAMQGTLKESTSCVAHRGLYNLQTKLRFNNLHIKDFVVNELLINAATDFKKLNIHGIYRAQNGGICEFNPLIDLTNKNYPFTSNIVLTHFTLNNILDIFQKTDAPVNLTIEKGTLVTHGTMNPFHLQGGAKLITKNFTAKSDNQLIITLPTIPIDARIDVTPKRFQIENALIGNKEKIKASGYFSFEDTMSLHFTSDKFVLTSIKLFDKLMTDIDIKGEGSLTGKYGALELSIDFLIHSLESHLIKLTNISGNIQKRYNELSINNVMINNSSLIAEGQSRIKLDKSNEVSLYGRIASLKLFELLKLPKTYTASINQAELSGEIKLDKKKTVNGSFNIAKIGAVKISDEVIDNLIFQGTIDNDTLNVLFQVTKKNARINLEGTIRHFDELNLNLFSENLSTESFTYIGKKGIPLSSKVLIKGLLSGRINNPIFNGTIALVETKFHGIPYENSLVHIDYLENKYLLNGNLFNEAIVTSCSYNSVNYTYSLDTKFDAIKLHELLGIYFTGRFENLETVVSGKALLKGSLKNDMHSGTLRLSKLIVLQDKYKLQNEGEVILGIENDKIILSPVRFQGINSKLSLQGFFETDGNMLLTAAGYSDLLFLDAFTRLEKTSGNTHFKLTIAGKPTNINLQGWGTIKNLRFGIPQVKGEFYNGMASFTLNEERLKLTSFTSDFSNGKITGNGEIILKNLHPQTLDLNFHVHNIEIMQSKDFRFQLLSSLSLYGPINHMLLKGTTTISNLKFNKRLDYKSKIFNITDLFKDSTKIKIHEPESEFLFLDIGVTALENILIQNELFDSSLLANLRITGSNRSMGLLGTIKVKEGTLEFRGEEFKIQSGSIEFIDPNKISFLYNVSAETQRSNYHIFLNASGDEENVNISLSSDPELSREDIISVLEVGVTSAERENLSLGKWEAAAAVSGKAQDILEKELIKKLKVIKSIQIVPTFSENSKTVEPRLIVSSEVIKGIDLNYKATLANTAEQEAEMEYKVTKKFSLLANWKDEGSNNDAEIGMDFKFRFEFK